MGSLGADDGGLEDSRVDEEHTRLLTYEHACTVAADRQRLLGGLSERLAQVIVGNDDCSGSVSFLETLDTESAELMMIQASFRAASMTLVDPVQRSLRDFLA